MSSSHFDHAETAQQLEAVEPGEIGLLIVGHGTRDPRGQAEMLAVVERVALRLPGIPCQSCSLEFATPTIPEGVARLVEQGVRRIIAMPLLLFAAGHVKQDIPAALAAAAAQHAGLPIRLSPYLGCDWGLVKLSAQRFDEATQTGRDRGVEHSPAETLLLMVGRGSRDPSANAEMASYARLVFEQKSVGWLEVCFTAMAEPSLARGLEFAAATRFAQIVVQPHLLFQGELLERVRASVTELARQGTKSWLLTEHLGVDDLLADAVVRMAGISSLHHSLAKNTPLER